MVRRADLANDEHVQRSLAAPCDFEPDRNTAARQRQHERIAKRLGLQSRRQLATCVTPVSEPHGVSQSLVRSSRHILTPLASRQSRLATAASNEPEICHTYVSNP